MIYNFNYISRKKYILLLKKFFEKNKGNEAKITKFGETDTSGILS